MTPKVSAATLRGHDDETGEVIECPTCAELRDVIAGHEEVIRRQSASIRKLRRNMHEEAKTHELYDTVSELFNYWGVVCGHSRSRFTTDRFWEAEPLVSRYGEDLCRKAIDGAAYDPFITKRRNGSQHRHDGWELIFRDAGHLEEFVNKAPRRQNGTH